MEALNSDFEAEIRTCVLSKELIKNMKKEDDEDAKDADATNASSAALEFKNKYEIKASQNKLPMKHAKSKFSSNGLKEAVVQTESVERTVELKESEVQTGSGKTTACALIEISEDEKVYIVTCFHCTQVFPLWDWTTFIKHSKEKHCGVNKSSEDLNCDYLRKKCSGLLIVKRKCAPNDNVQADKKLCVENRELTKEKEEPGTIAETEKLQRSLSQNAKVAKSTDKQAAKYEPKKSGIEKTRTRFREKPRKPRRLKQSQNINGKYLLDTHIFKQAVEEWEKMKYKTCMEPTQVDGADLKFIPTQNVKESILTNKDIKVETVDVDYNVAHNVEIQNAETATKKSQLPLQSQVKVVNLMPKPMFERTVEESIKLEVQGNVGASHEPLKVVAEDFIDENKYDYGEYQDYGSIADDADDDLVEYVGNVDKSIDYNDGDKHLDAHVEPTVNNNTAMAEYLKYRTKEPQFVYCPNELYREHAYSRVKYGKLPVQTKVDKMGFERDPVIVMDYLDQIKTLPPLWYSRYKCGHEYDDAMTCLTTSINKKWKLNIPLKQMRESVEKLKRWYYYVSRKLKRSSELNTDHNVKYLDYYHKCVEFMPSRNAMPGDALLCDLCTAHTFSEEELKVHRYAQHQVGVPPYKCRACGKGFAYMKEALKHENALLNIIKVPCITCPAKGYTECLRIVQVVVKGTHDVVQTCAKNIDNALQEYQKDKAVAPKSATPMSWADPEKPQVSTVYFCPLCISNFEEEADLLDHLFNRHNVGDLVHECKKCQRRFARPEKLAKHMIMHTLTITCKTCSKRFQDKTSLDKHTCKPVEEKPEPPKERRFTCNTCGKKFFTKSVLHQHDLNMHVEARYKCKLCPKKFSRSFLLKEHIKVHKDQRDFVCDKCGRSFVRNKQLKEHLGCVHGNKAQCVVCGRSFSSRAVLRKHQRNQHVALEGHVENLAAVKKRLSSKSPYITDSVTKRVICLACGNTFKDRNQCYRHMVAKHGYVVKKRKSAKKKEKAASKKKAKQTFKEEYLEEEVEPDPHEINQAIQDLQKLNENENAYHNNIVSDYLNILSEDKKLFD